MKQFISSFDEFIVEDYDYRFDTGDYYDRRKSRDPHGFSTDYDKDFSYLVGKTVGLKTERYGRIDKVSAKIKQVENNGEDIVLNFGNIGAFVNKDEQKSNEIPLDVIEKGGKVSISVRDMSSGDDWRGILNIK